MTPDAQGVSDFQTHASRIPIIAMTANTMQGDRERCMEAGMDDFVAKAGRLSEIKARMGELALALAAFQAEIALSATNRL